LDLYGYLLTVLPKEIGNLKSLTSLNLGLNQLTTLPKEIGNLINLTSLVLSENELTELPKEIGNLTSLASLDLGYNQLTILPKEIGNLTNLTSLELYGNKFTELPKEIGNMTSLTSLYLGVNQLTTLPKEIGNLKKLTSLVLCENELTELPKEIGNLTSLTRLDLRSNQLTILPKEIGNLRSLTRLVLRENKLTELPKEIGKLTSLRILDLSNNNSLDNASFLISFKNYNREISIFNKNDRFFYNDNILAIVLPILTTLPAEVFNLKNISADNWLSLEMELGNNKNYSQAFQCGLKATEKDTTNYNVWYNLSFYSLFVKQYTLAIAAAEKSLALNAQENSVITNIALGYVLNNQWNKAEPIYKEWKDKHFYGDVRFCKELFLQDIADLEEAGINHPDFEKVRKLLK